MKEIYKKIINCTPQVITLGVIFIVPVSENNLKELSISSLGCDEVVFSGDYRPFVRGMANSAEVRMPLLNIMPADPRFHQVSNTLIVNEIEDFNNNIVI